MFKEGFIKLPLTPVPYLVRNLIYVLANESSFRDLGAAGHCQTFKVRCHQFNFSPAWIRLCCSWERRSKTVLLRKDFQRHPVVDNWEQGPCKGFCYAQLMYRMSNVPIPSLKERETFWQSCLFFYCVLSLSQDLKIWIPVANDWKCPFKLKCWTLEFTPESSSYLIWTAEEIFFQFSSVIKVEHSIWMLEKQQYINLSLAFTQRLQVFYRVG